MQVMIISPRTRKKDYPPIHPHSMILWLVNSNPQSNSIATSIQILLQQEQKQILWRLIKH